MLPEFCSDQRVPGSQLVLDSTVVRVLSSVRGREAGSVIPAHIEKNREKPKPTEKEDADMETKEVAGWSAVKLSTMRMGFVFTVAAVAIFLGFFPAFPQEPERVIPGLFDTRNYRVEVVDVMFTKELRGLNGAFKESQPEKYRGLLLTLSISKPGGADMRLYPSDIALHYTRGNGEYGVAKCSGMSFMSTTQNSDRQMVFFHQTSGYLS